MALVVTRQVNQTIVIGPPEKPIAVVRINKIDGSKVRVEIDADRSVSVLRGELLSVALCKDGGQPVGTLSTAVGCRGGGGVAQPTDSPTTDTNRQVNTHAITIRPTGV